MSKANYLAPEKLAEKYEAEFEPSNYGKTYFNKKYTFLYPENVLGMLHKIFSINITEGGTMLDLGCGPVIYGTISASRRIKRIVCSDFLDTALTEIEKWIKDEPDALDWSKCFEDVAKLENEPNPKRIELRVRNAIKDFVHCDLRLPNPIAPLVETFDVVFVGLTFGSISSSDEMFAQYISHGANLIKEGGHLIYSGHFEADHYYVGDVKFPAHHFTRPVLEAALMSAKLQPILWAIFPRIEAENAPCAKYESSFVVLAKK